MEAYDISVLILRNVTISLTKFPLPLMTHCARHPNCRRITTTLQSHRDASPEALLGIIVSRIFGRATSVAIGVSCNDGRLASSYFS